MSRILPLDARSYARSALHGEERAWRETNCYVDLWIELLHALGLDPVAPLAFTLDCDFEGDQWTFFKYPLEDLRTVYGLEVLELAVWLPLTTHLEEQVSRGRPVIVEVDSFHLPDTAGVSYGVEHTKSSIAVQEIDLAHRRLGYFHGPGYFQLEGADFAGLFQLDVERDPRRLPPYVEIVKLDAQVRPKPAELTARALGLLREHLRRRPSRNPFTAWRERFERDLEWLRTQPLPVFHGYAFATLRQLGANFELTASFLRWLEGRGETGLEPAAVQFDAISGTAKTLMLKLARAVMHKKPLDLAPFASLEHAWAGGMGQLADRYDR